MDAHNLVDMANRIGKFFVAMPDRAEAVEGISQHIHRFWEPRMRRDLLKHVDEHQAEGLDPIVMEAITAHRAEWTPIQEPARVA